AQIIGGEGVDKRIDVLATAMQAKLTAVQLKDLDLAYAPPYSSAKDPVNMVGFMVENLQAGLFKQFHYEDIAKLPRDGSVTLLDTRTEPEYQRGHIEGFINIPLHTLRDRMAELPTGKPVYVNCHSGLRSYIACRMLAQSGYECYNFSGGYRFYDANHREAEFGEQTMKQAYPCGMEK
ncbi:MAG: CoA-disulfide reductase, partial [Firmicutes bacterium]|nr:CoA-disulfide reductase [Bacillota bacterium]